MPRFHTIAALTLALMLLTAMYCAALDLGVPDLEDVAGDVLKDKIPGLNDVLEEEPAISTSFDDAVYGVPAIDGFDPTVTAPMTQLPTTGDGGYILALPGAYELEARSFCLHAGTHGPGQGEGYLWAPLKGAQAGVIRSVLNNYMAHPELEQRKVQSLVWGIQARAKIQNMPDELRDVAEALLTPKQIRELNGGALAIIPDELMDQAFVDVPDEVRMVMEAEARLRDRLRQEVYDFDALEEIAVLSGDPDVDEGGPIIPRARWSFEPGGFFIRFEPHGYSHTTVQIYAPEPFQAVTDELGRITSLTDRGGLALNVEYADADATVAAGDPGVVAHALAGIHLQAPNDRPLEIACTPEDMLLTGVPNGNGGFDGALGALYDAGAGTAVDIRELAGNVEGASPESPLVGNVVNLAHLAGAIERIAARQGADTRDLRVLEALGHRAVASELAVMLTGGEEDTAFRPVERETRLAMLPWATGTVKALGRVAWANGDFTARPVWRSAYGTGTPANRDRQRLGISGGSRDLPVYDPSDDEEEEEGPSGGDDKGTVKRARNAIDTIGKGKDAIEIMGGPAGWAAGKIGMGIPDYLFGKILDFNFDMWGKATKALGGDPPVEDYDEIATPRSISLPPYEPADEISPEHTMAVQALSEALAENLAIVRAANITEDRLGGAMAAGDDQWTGQQAAMLVEYKRQAGEGMMEISVCLRSVLQALQNAGVSDITVTPAAVQAYQQRLQSEGFNAEEQQAAQILGINDAELQTLLAERIAADPNEVAGSITQSHQELAEALWWLGMGWSNLPAYEPAP